MSSNPTAGKLAKLILAEKRSKLFYNIFWCVSVLTSLALSLIVCYQLLCDHVLIESEQTYIEVKDGFLVTAEGSYELSEADKQIIGEKTLKRYALRGKNIKLRTSKINGDLIEVVYNERTIYKTETTDIIPYLIVSLIIILPMLGLSIFMLIVINIKNPSKRIYKFRRSFIK